MDKNTLATDFLKQESWTKERILTKDVTTIEEWDSRLYFVNIYAVHATLIQTLAQEEILQSRRFQQVWQLANVLQHY